MTKQEGEMRVYSLALYAERQLDGGATHSSVTTGIGIALNDDDMRVRGLKRCRQYFAEADGYANHQVSIGEILDNQGMNHPADSDTQYYLWLIPLRKNVTDE